MKLNRLYVLVAHEPKRDPRIDWVARFAAKRFLVTVFGRADALRPEASSESHNGYETQRLVMSCQGFVSFVLAMGRFVAVSPPLWLPLLACVVISPFVAVIWLIRKVVLGLIPKLLRLVLPKSTCQAIRACLYPAFVGKRIDFVFGWLSRTMWLIHHFTSVAATLYREVRKTDKPDIVYCNDLDTLMAGVFLKRWFDCKLIYDAHEFWAHADPASPWWEVQSYLLLERNLARHVDAAFTVNHLLSERMSQALGIPFGSLPNCEPIGIANGAIANAHGDQKANTWLPINLGRKRMIDELAQGRTRFLFQGGFAAERGIEELIQVWSKVPADKAVLLLRGPDNEYRERCAQLAKGLGLIGKTVFFLESIREHELVAGAAEADVGIIPYKAVTINYKYCCPNKLSQYMQAGLAILSNDTEFMKYAIERYQCGLTYHVDDLSGWLTAINRLIDDEAFRETCQKQATKMVVEEYNWECQSQLLYRTCAELVGLPVNQESRTTSTLVA